MLRIQLLLTAHLATTLGPPSSLAWIIAVASRRAPFSDLGPSQSTCSPAAGKMPCSMMSGHAVPQAGTLKWIFLLTRETKVSTVCRAFRDRAPCLSLCSRSVAVLFTLPPCCPVATLTRHILTLLQDFPRSAASETFSSTATWLSLSHKSLLRYYLLSKVFPDHHI